MKILNNVTVVKLMYISFLKSFQSNQSVIGRDRGVAKTKKKKFDTVSIKGQVLR